ncbi:MAG: hypothetical protein LBL01_05455 [Bifidobacteriaceae bacterium]|jgi:hypothetical protein|nr:hypothetical protein [Bifidobacteriaceae bacterium]
MGVATLSDLLRTPKSVIEMTEDGAVQVVRRDGPDLVLLKAEDLAAQREGLELASRVMRALLARGGDAKGALLGLFGWAALFTEDELGEFADEMERLVWSAAELNAYGALLERFRRWEGTAEAYAAGMPRGDGSDLTWLEEPVPVDRP